MVIPECRPPAPSPRAFLMTWAGTVWHWPQKLLESFTEFTVWPEGEQRDELQATRQKAGRPTEPQAGEVGPLNTRPRGHPEGVSWEALQGRRGLYLPPVASPTREVCAPSCSGFLCEFCGSVIPPLSGHDLPALGLKSKPATSVPPPDQGTSSFP